MASELTFAAFQSRRYIAALDGLRALAIFGVLLHHTRGKPFAMLHGYRGVWVFFVLSGFLITTLALREAARRRFDQRAFVIRRAFRILPLYYLALCAYLVWVFVLGRETHADLFAANLMSFVFYLPEFPIFSSHFDIPFGQAWSLGIEEKFYVVWPFLAFVLLGQSRHRLALTVALIAAGFVLIANGGWLAQMWGSYTDILIGCLLAQLLHTRAGYEKLAVLGRTGVAWTVIAALGLATLLPGMGQVGERLFSLLAAAAIAALVTNVRGPATVVSTPWLVRVGIWSYAIYLTHDIVFHAVAPLAPPGRIGDVMTLVLTLLVDLPICWALHSYVERPLIELGRGIAARKRAAAMPIARAP